MRTMNFDVGKRANGRRLLESLLAALVISGPASASAATILVDSLGDNVPFVSGDGACTLREAIANANYNASATADTSADCSAGSGADLIAFGVTGTITLDGERLRTSDETHDAANTLTIDGGSSITISGGNSSQVLLVVDTPLTLESITIADGDGGTGEPGGIKNYEPLTIRNSTLTGNVADDDGGAILNLGSLEIVNSTLTANTAKNGSGGAIYNDSPSGTVVIRNSTISGNSAKGGGGGIFNADGEVQIINVTVTGNTGTDGGGIAGGAATYVVSNSIVANNISTGGGISDCDPDAAAYFTTYGNNVDTDGSCAGFGQTTSTDLKLGPLFFNGGPTKTQALLAGSVAIDAGVQSVCDDSDVTEDQRGAARPADGNADGTAVCDIGAYELTPPPPPAPVDLAIAKTAAKTAKTGKQLTYTITVKNNGPNAATGFVVNDILPAGTSFVSVSASGATACSTPLSGFTGTVSCNYGALTTGSSISPISLIVKVTAKGNTQLNNTATVSLTDTTTVDPNTANNSATATSKVSK